MARKKATAKRSNNEGSVYQNKRGLWVAQATIGYDENGKQIRKLYQAKPARKPLQISPLIFPKAGQESKSSSKICRLKSTCNSGL